MSAITQLRQTVTDELAEVSGAPRPVLPPPARSAPAGPAPVVELRPPGGSGPDEVLPDRVLHEAGVTRKIPAEADAEAVRRIAGIARSVAQGSLEVLAGTRPLQQLARWLDPENYERLQLRANLVRCIRPPAADAGAARTRTPRHVVIRSVRVCPVSADVYETSVVAFDQTRVRAVALRIEQRRGSWRITALEIG